MIKKDKKGKEIHHKMYMVVDLAMLEKNDIFIVLWNVEKQESDSSTFTIIQRAKQKHKKRI